MSVTKIRKGDKESVETEQFFGGDYNITLYTSVFRGNPTKLTQTIDYNSPAIKTLPLLHLKWEGTRQAQRLLIMERPPCAFSAALAIARITTAYSFSHWNPFYSRFKFVVETGVVKLATTSWHNPLHLQCAWAHDVPNHTPDRVPRTNDVAEIR